MPGLSQAHIADSPERQTVAASLEMLHAHSYHHSPWDRELALNALERALLQVLRSVHHTQVRDPRIADVINEVVTKPAAVHTLASLARVANLSPSRFGHLFREQMGLSPARFVRDVRVREASRLLELTALSIADIATLTGFASPYHLSATFRSDHGLSPRAYRQRNRAQP